MRQAHIYREQAAELIIGDAMGRVARCITGDSPVPVLVICALSVLVVLLAANLGFWRSHAYVFGDYVVTFTGYADSLNWVTIPFIEIVGLLLLRFVSHTLIGTPQYFVALAKVAEPRSRQNVADRLTLALSPRTFLVAVALSVTLNIIDMASVIWCNYEPPTLHGTRLLFCDVDIVAVRSGTQDYYGRKDPMAASPMRVPCSGVDYSTGINEPDWSVMAVANDVSVDQSLPRKGFDNPYFTKQMLFNAIVYLQQVIVGTFALWVFIMISWHQWVFIESITFARAATKRKPGRIQPDFFDQQKMFGLRELSNAFNLVLTVCAAGALLALISRWANTKYSKEQLDVLAGLRPSLQDLLKILQLSYTGFHDAGQVILLTILLLVVSIGLIPIAVKVRPFVYFQGNELEILRSLLPTGRWRGKSGREGSRWPDVVAAQLNVLDDTRKAYNDQSFWPANHAVVIGYLSLLFLCCMNFFVAGAFRLALPSLVTLEIVLATISFLLAMGIVKSLKAITTLP